jgi:arylsulfatase A-like enzyme
VPSPVLRTLTGRRGLLVLGAAVLVAVVVAAVVVVVGGGDGDGRPVATGHDVVVIMTDDQTLASLATMPHVQELLVEQGTSYTTAIASFPNCCPSRATYLTGRYAHTTGVVDNVEPWGGVGHFDPRRALPVALEQAGYDTIHIGKYLNGWGEDGDISPPPGWSRWFGLIDPTTYGYTDFDVSVDGSRRSFGADDYSTDVLADEAVAQIRDRADDERPFFLSFTPLAPHAEAPEAHAAADGTPSGGFTTPLAPARHADSFSAADLPRPPSYDEEDVGDKPISLRRPPISESSAAFIDRYLAAELGALAAVDDAVERIVAALDETGRLDQTVIVFTSDNGFLHGQHRFVYGKYVLWEPSIRVPLVIRGPGFGSGVEVDTPVANIDLAPTIAAAARVDLLDPPDGVALNGPDVLQVDDRPILLENYDGGRINSVGVRTRRWSLITHPSGERELYDLEADPDQLDNLAGSTDRAVAQVERDLMTALGTLEDCRGADCTRPVPPSARVTG